MSNTQKNIRFNFDDNGSLKRIKSMYEDLYKTMSQRSNMYGQNAAGAHPVQQARFIQDEIKQMRELIALREKDYKDRLESFRRLEIGQTNLNRAISEGNISESEYQRRMKLIEGTRKELLSGTGYRKESTFRVGGSSELESSKDILKSMEKTFEESKVLLRNILSNDKETALQQIKAIEENSGSSQAEMIAAQRARASIESRRSPEKGGGSIVGDLFTFSNLQDLLGSTQRTLTSTSPTDIIRGATETITSGIVGVADAIAKGMESTPIVGLFAPILRIGARAGKTAADTFTEMQMQMFEAQQSYQSAGFANRALTGSWFDPRSMSDYGYSALQSQELMGALARSQGSSRGLSNVTRSAQLLERGFGIDSSSFQQLLELTRTGVETDRDIQQILGGMWKEGQQIFRGDRTFLNEFATKNFALLYRQAQQTQSTVDSRTIMSALTMFDSIGGQFSARHPISMQNISSIDSALKSPGSDSFDALSFIALRRAMPGASYADILRERGKGIYSEVYFKAVMDQISAMGGQEAYQMQAIQGAFGLSPDAATSLIRNRESIRNLSGGGLRAAISGLEEMGRENTTLMERSQARIDNALISGIKDRVDTVFREVVETWKNAFNNASFVYDAPSDTITLKTMPVQNKTKKPGDSDITRSSFGTTHTYLH